MLITKTYWNFLFFISHNFKVIYNKVTTLEGFTYIRNLFILLLIDGLVLDDEPLWEPLEWSVMQTWILYIFIFSWAAEVIFSSRYGLYTNRDKIVWIGLYKVYSLMQAWFLLNIIFTTAFVTLPFYFEISYSISYAVVWWNWYTSIFFFKFTTIFSVIILLVIIVRLQLRHSPHSSAEYLLLLVPLLILYLLYFNFIVVLFGFFTDPTEFKSSGWSNLSRVVHGPLKWGYGSESRDHFAYHRTTSVFWYKNDPLMAGSMLFLNIFIFKFLFFLLLQSISITRTLAASKELSFNIITYFYSTVKQFLYFIYLLMSLVFLSFIYQFMRYPFELYWFMKFISLEEAALETLRDFLNLIFF